MFGTGPVTTPLLVSLIALILSTASFILSMFSLRRQGIPDRFEVRRRIIETLEETHPELQYETEEGPVFEIVYVTVLSEAGLTSWQGFGNLLKEYITGQLQGKTSVGVSVENGRFVEDFEGDQMFSSNAFGGLKVEVSKASNQDRIRVITIPYANASEVSGYIRWLCIDELSVYTQTHILSR